MDAVVSDNEPDDLSPSEVPLPVTSYPEVSADNSLDSSNPTSQTMNVNGIVKSDDDQDILLTVAPSTLTPTNALEATAPSLSNPGDLTVEDSAVGLEKTPADPSLTAASSPPTPVDTLEPSKCPSPSSPGNQTVDIVNGHSTVGSNNEQADTSLTGIPASPAAPNPSEASSDEASSSSRPSNQTMDVDDNAPDKQAGLFLTQTPSSPIIGEERQSIFFKTFIELYQSLLTRATVI